ncbi:MULTISPECIES: MauE/DoxX family redox-associated membrane protein [Sphingobacterium]|uniref:Methylamine utilisation protein MauE domain-containing protein n=1 Tax=Sphingobacterium zeae TaxID=1776859 RepID=A0ABU0TZY8_9SPHI|nr:MULTISPECIES: MauE/DoxX family redox-associated membrane protein [Sphingobacterium]MDQ1148281.1 hypothetical protein [Sphingobacterium zeae]MDR6733973.1 hypothetical protein [Sphingobacterium sp. 2149]
MRTKKKIETIAQYGFLLLWGVTAAVKLSSWDTTKSEMALQSFPYWMEQLLLWGLPALYIGLTLILLYRPTTKLGLRLSTVVIVIFTIYLLVGVSGVLGYTPCACAGIWPTNNHWLHIALNSIFITIGIIYWVSAHKSHTEKDVVSDLGRKEDTILS